MLDYSENSKKQYNTFSKDLSKQRNWASLNILRNNIFEQYICIDIYFIKRAILSNFFRIVISQYIGLNTYDSSGRYEFILSSSNSTFKHPGLNEFFEVGPKVLVVFVFDITQLQFRFCLGGTIQKLRNTNF